MTFSPTFSFTFLSRFFCYAALLLGALVLIANPMSAAEKPAEKPADKGVAEAPLAEKPDLPPKFSESAKTAYSEKMKALRAAMDGQKWEQAVKISTELTSLRPREPQARFIRSVALSHLNRIEDAKKELIALTTDYPELPEPHNNLASIHAKSGNYILARDELERAIAVAPDYTTAHANLADLYVRLAVEHYRLAISQTQDARMKKDLSAHVDVLSPLVK